MNFSHQKGVGIMYMIFCSVCCGVLDLPSELRGVVHRGIWEDWKNGVAQLLAGCTIV